MIRLITFCFFLISGILFAQEVGFQWAGGFGTSENESVTNLTADEDGNVYVVGGFTETLDFDPGEGEVLLTSSGSEDCFVLKLAPTGELLWARAFGGIDSDKAHSVAVNSDGDLLITGSYQETVDFDPGLGEFEITAIEGLDGFILKLNDEGEFLSVITFSGSSTEKPLEIALDESDNIYITGFYDGTTDFDPGPGIFELVSVGDDDIFILKLDALGDFEWARSIGGGLEDRPYGIDLDSENSVYVIGGFEGVIDVDPGPGLISETGFDFNDGFLLKLDADGNYFWHTTILNETSNWIRGIVIDQSDHIYVGGTFGNTMDFDPGPDEYNITSAGSSDCFVQKLDIDRNLLWVKSFGSSDGEVIRGIGTDSGGNVVVTGTFSEVLDFDPNGGVFDLTPDGNSDIFVQSMSADGNFRWAKSFGGVDYDNGRRVSITAGDDVIVNGLFRGTADFNPGLEEHPIASNGLSDFYVVKLSPCEASSSTDAMTACNSYTWLDGVIYTEDNNTATVTLENIAGCDSVITLDLTITELNNGVTQSGALLTSDDADALYQWLDCDDDYAEIEGETGVSFTPLEDGNYAVRVEQGACVDTSDCIMIEGVGISKNNLDVISVYPNPSSRQIRINGLNNTNYKMILYSSTGEICMEQYYSEKEFVDLSLPKGQYFLLLVGENSTKYIKVFITG